MGIISSNTAWCQSRDTQLGTNAGMSITTGDDNTLLGYDAGRAIDNESMNVIIGSQAGIGTLDITGGEFLDSGALLLQPYSAYENVYIGYRAGWQSTTGTDNVFVGFEAGKNNGNATDNTFIGAEAGENNISGGNDNTFIGEESGFQNTTGDDNTFIGEDAGAVISTGSDNVAVGAGALSNGGAFTSDAIAGASYSNVAVGIEAGYDAGDYGTTYNNTFVGAHAGGDNGAGHVNTFIGAQAGTNSEYADYCTFVGAGAGWDNNRVNHTNDANRNTYMGIAAGFSNRIGSDNAIFGAFADYGTWQGASEAQLTDAFSWGSWSSFDGLASGVNVSRDINRVVTMGAYATSRRNDAISIGYSADATLERAIALGSGAQATHVDSIAIGYQAASHGANIAVIGNATTTSIDPGTDGVTTLGTMTNRFEDTFSQVVSVHAATGNAATVNLWADDATADDDKWKISAADGGNLSVSSSATGADIVMLAVDNTGNLTVTGDVTVQSDERLKEDIRPIGNALDLLTAVEGKTYTWIPGSGHDQGRHFGLIAQEVAEILPELVNKDEEGMLSVNYLGFVPILINSVKEMQEENRLLKEQLANQQEDIAWLKEQINR